MSKQKAALAGIFTALAQVLIATNNITFGATSVKEFLKPIVRRALLAA